MSDAPPRFKSEPSEGRERRQATEHTRGSPTGNRRSRLPLGSSRRDLTFAPSDSVASVARRTGAFRGTTASAGALRRVKREREVSNRE